MAAYDYGGGCSCGLHKECVCELENKSKYTVYQELIELLNTKRDAEMFLARVVETEEVNNITISYNKNNNRGKSITSIDLPNTLIKLDIVSLIEKYIADVKKQIEDRTSIALS